MKTYNDTLYFDEEEEVNGQKFIFLVPDCNYLRKQREGLKMSQQEVADAAKITLRQYQRFESGERSMRSASLRIGLSICDALKLDPHRFN